MSLEVEKMSQGKQLSHFQAMAMLRKALVASFIATPGNSNKGVMEMKSTENRSEHFTKVCLSLCVTLCIVNYDKIPGAKAMMGKLPKLTTRLRTRLFRSSKSNVLFSKMMWGRKMRSPQREKTRRKERFLK